MSLKTNGILGNPWDELSLDADPAFHVRFKKSFTDLIRPEILTRSANGPRKPLHRTAYLDGIRGFAAFLVFWHHHQLWARDSIEIGKVLENAFGYDGQYYFACLPFIRVFFSGGHFAVSIFFVISGYVLSTKPLSYIHAGEYVKLGDSLASSLFRRWLRLYIPVIITTFIFMSIFHVFGIWTDNFDQQSNWREEAWAWYCELKNFSFVFNTGGKPWLSYNRHLWSIPVEFKGSIVIFTTTLALSRATHNARLCCFLGLIVYFTYIVDGVFYAMFVAGMLLADLDLLSSSNPSRLPRFLMRLEPVKELIFVNLFIAGLYLGGVPSYTSDTQVLSSSPGWGLLSILKPQAVFDPKSFYNLFAAVFFVASVPWLPFFVRFFEGRFCQYLGRISFAFYFTHGPVMFTIGDRLYVAAGWVRDSHRTKIPGWINLFPLSKSGPLGFEISFLLPALVSLVITLWLAEVGTKLIDKPAVRFVQWAYRRALPLALDGKL